MADLPRRRLNKETFPVGTRVPKSVVEEIERVVRAGFYVDVSDYLRDVIRRDLEARKSSPEPQEG